MLALGLVCFFWGTTWVASRAGVQYMPALQLAGLRQLLGGLLYCVFFLLKGERLPKGREWGMVLVLSLLNFVLSNGLSTWGLQFISAGLGSIIGAIYPLWIAVFGLVGGKVKMPWKVMAGLLLGFAGICVIFYEHLSDLLNPDFRFGIFISLIATWSWALGTVYMKKHSAGGFNPYFNLGLQMVISGLALLGITHVTHDAVAIAAIPWQSWAAIAYLTIFSSVLSFVAFLYALQHLPAELVALYAYVNPLVAVSLGWVLFGELLTPFVAVGVPVTLLGVYLVNRSIQKVVR